MTGKSLSSQEMIKKKNPNNPYIEMKMNDLVFLFFFLTQ